MLRRGIVLFALAATTGLGVYVQPASATHDGTTVDCGSAGTFTLQAQPTGQAPESPGFPIEAPHPGSLLRFEEGGVLTVFKFVENGQVFINKNETGRASNNVDEITCTFTSDRFSHICQCVVHAVVEVTGILNTQ